MIAPMHPWIHWNKPFVLVLLLILQLHDTWILLEVRSRYPSDSMLGHYYLVSSMPIHLLFSYRIPMSFVINYHDVVWPDLSWHRNTERAQRYLSFIRRSWSQSWIIKYQALLVMNPRITPTNGQLRRTFEWYSKRTFPECDTSHPHGLRTYAKDNTW